MIYPQFIPIYTQLSTTFPKNLKNMDKIMTNSPYFSQNFSQITNEQTHQDSYFMRLAIQLAKKGQFTTRPNPCVGCVIVKDNNIIGEGYHYQAGRPHAEVFALRQAKQAVGDDLTGATAYVTLEPCSHHGRTPPCADALINANISRVVIAVTDPNPKVAGGGIEKLTNAGIAVTTGVCHDEAYALNQGFFKTMSGGLPYVRLKIASSLDGRIAMQSGESKWITGATAREDVQRLRAISGAIITGSQTVLADSPSLNVRSPQLACLSNIPQPLLVVLDRRKRLNVTDDLIKSWVKNQAENRPFYLCQDDVSLTEILRQLRDDYHIHDVMVEAGATLSTAFLQQNLVDELIIYQAPCLLGSSAIPMFTADFAKMCEQLRFNLQSHETIGDDIKFVFRQ